jgi:hypothetical protein
MNFPLRCLFAAVLLLSAVGAAQAGQPIALTSQPLALDRSDPARIKVGKLIWRGGLVLHGRHADFGGYSGLRIEDGGQHLRAVSDTGTWLTLDLIYDPRGMLTGAGNAQVGPLRDLAGVRLRSKTNTDAESMAVLPDGSVLVGFEQKHRIWRYPPGKEAQGGGMDGRPVPFPTPPDIVQAPANEGLECITLLQDGRLLLISEDLKRSAATVAVWIGTADGESYRWQDAQYPIVGRFRPSDATTLPNGDVVVLERSYSPFEGVRVRVMRLRRADIAANVVLKLEELAVLQEPVVTENLEGVSAARGANGETLLWLIADDNFNPLQQTILLHFAIDE